VSCQTHPDACNENEECILNIESGNYTCVCPQGFTTFNGNCNPTCLNVNCSTNENCVDLQNGGQCQCNDGYEKDEANICQIVDGCVAFGLECREDQICVGNQISGYNCSCRSNFVEFEGVCTLESCQTNDEACNLNEVCELVGENYTCVCPQGFIVVDEICVATCANTNCSSVETCDDTSTGAQCVCNDGYTRNQTSGLCQISDGCVAFGFPCGTNEVCTEIDAGVYSCECQQGFLLGDNNTCIEIISCNELNCENLANEECVENVNGQGECVCSSGYERDQLSGVCTDIDECNDQILNTCDQLATCVNTAGSFSCNCPCGYVDEFGNGRKWN